MPWFWTQLLALIPLLGAADAAVAQPDMQFPEASETVQELIDLWDRADAGCRLSRNGDVEVAAACLSRSVYGAAINERGWCKGREGEANADMAWHECDAASLRFPPFRVPGYQSDL